MKVACFIPIKENSERVKGKNFRKLNGRKLYEYIIETAVLSKQFDEIYIDTNSSEISDYAKKLNLKVIIREEVLATNLANGNDLLNHHYQLFPGYDYYFQLFATAPFLQVDTVIECVQTLTQSTVFDSCFTALKHQGFFWLNENPINYRPDVLPRSQDMTPVVEETTGLYGISNQSLFKYKCRIGANPYIKFVDKFEAVDINTEDDFKIAEHIGTSYWNR